MQPKKCGSPVQGLSADADKLYHELVGYLGQEDRDMHVMIDALTATLNNVLLHATGTGKEKLSANLAVSRNVFHNFCLLISDERFIGAHRMDEVTFNEICVADSAEALMALGVRMDADQPRETTMAITKWTPKMTFKCPECSKALQEEGSKHHCADCNLDVQLVMKMGAA